MKPTSHPGISTLATIIIVVLFAGVATGSYFIGKKRNPNIQPVVQDTTTQPPKANNVPSPNQQNNNQSLQGLVLSTDKNFYDVTSENSIISGTVVKATLKNNSNSDIAVDADGCDGSALGVRLEKNTSGKWGGAWEQNLGFCHTGPLNHCVSIPKGESVTIDKSLVLLPGNNYRFSLDVGVGSMCDDEISPSGGVGTTIYSNEFRTPDRSGLLQNFTGTTASFDGESNEGRTSPDKIKLQNGKMYILTGTKLPSTITAGMNITIKGYLLTDASPLQNRALEYGVEEGMVLYVVEYIK